jgi:predicted Ser/Thr protein kinase
MDQMIGKTIDSYTILEVLGRGGMGVVYKALDNTLDRDVAIKMMDALIASDPNFLKRFQSEAKALAKLQNPNIVGIFALRQTEFGVCIVMEFVKGKTLGDLLKQSILIPIPRATNIFKQVLTALDHAHKGGVIHRDIKPGNIMLAEGDVVKVTDFGLAKIQKGNASTMTMGTAGTLYYMSPEQIRGLSNVDHRGDIYSAGMALYETLAGHVPFKPDDSDFVVAQLIVDGKFPPLDKANGTVPKELVKIVMKSIDKDPTKRYQSCAEMVRALEQFEATVKPGSYPMTDAPTMVAQPGRGPLSSRGPMSGPKSFVTAPKNRLLAGIGIGVALVLLVTYFFLRPIIFPEEGTLTVRTTPAGGKVYVDNVLIDKVPVEGVPLEVGKRRVSVTWGAIRLDTSVAVEAGKPIVLALAMKKPAEIPRNLQDPMQGTKEPVQTAGNTEKTEHERTREVAEPTTGTLLLEAAGDGQVKVDDGPYREPGNRLTVPAGSRTVTFKSASGLTKSTTVQVLRGESKGIKCYFDGNVAVGLSTEKGGGRAFGYIIVDGVQKDASAPGTISLPAGTHRIGIARKGYETVPAEHVVKIEPSFDGPPKTLIAFKLRQK